MLKDYFYSLINSILFFILGLIVFVSPSTIITTVTYVLGSFLILIGLYNLLIYNRILKKTNIKEKDKLSSGIVLTILGVVTIICATSIDVILRSVIGFWLVYNGILRVFDSIKSSFDNSYLIIKIVIGTIFILSGLYMILVSNLILSAIGLFIMFYAIIDIIEKISFKKK